MRFVDYVAIAFRNIRRQKMRSVLTVFAVVIGATSVTIMLTIVFSAKDFITNQFEQNGTFQQIEVSPEQNISWGNNDNQCVGQSSSTTGCGTILSDSLAKKIAALPHVVGVVRETQVNDFDGLFYGNKKLQLNNVVAYDANGIIKNTMLAGRDIGPNDKDGVLTITSDFANALGYKNNYQALIGKTVTLHATNYSGVGSNPLAQYEYQQAHCNNLTPGQGCQSPATEITGKIIGIASASGIGGNSSSYTVRVPLVWARGMEEQQNYTVPSQYCFMNGCNVKYGHVVVTDTLAQNGYNSLIVKVDKASNAATVAKSIRNTFHVGAADAQTAIQQQLAVFNILGAILGSIGGIALVVAAVGVINTMVMSILERTREIGIMRAVGARRSTISRLFTFEAALLGLMGGIVGVLIAFGLTLIGNPIINHQLKGNGINSSNILSMPPWLIISVLVGTTVIGILAGLYPARKAAKLDPVEALHYE